MGEAERKLRELKKSGVSKANAEKEQLRQAKNKREPGARSKKGKDTGGGMAESADGQVELIKRPREYDVEFKFPEVAEISPPILEVRDVDSLWPSAPFALSGELWVDMQRVSVSLALMAAVRVPS